MLLNSENIDNNLPELKEIEDKELEELVNEYLKLEDQRNKNIDKLVEINREIAILRSNLEK